MRRLIQEYKTLGFSEFGRTRKRKASDKIKSGYHRLVQTPVIQSRYGVAMVANWSDTTFRFCVNAAYGFELHDLLVNHPDEFTFVDIGSNQGLYSLIACKNPACKAVFAFEPMPETYKLLQQNIAANHLQQVTAINAAVSESTGTSTISVDPAHTGGASLHQTNKNFSTQVKIDTVDHAKLNELIKPHGKVFVKVDVEGHEEAVLAQIAKCRFREQIHVVHYEVDEKWVNPQTLQTTLQQSGFHSFERIDSQRSHHYDVIARRA